MFNTCFKKNDKNVPVPFIAPLRTNQCGEKAIVMSSDPKPCGFRNRARFCRPKNKTTKNYTINKKSWHLSKNVRLKAVGIL